MFGWLTKRQGHARSHPPEAVQRSQRLCHEGHAAQLNGDLPAAQLCFQEAISLDPANAHAHHLMGVWYAQHLDMARASLHYQRAFALNPEFELACQDACRVLLQLGQFEDAQKLVAAGLALNPSNAEFHYFDGNLNFLHGALDAALDSYREALALGADHSQLRSYLGAILLQRNDVGSALTHLQRATELDPRNAEAQLDLGVVQTRLGNVKEAIHCHEMAISLNPEHLQAYSCLLFALVYSAESPPSRYRSVASDYATRARKAVRALPPVAAASVVASPPKRMRIGWVSGDFRRHVNMAFLKPVLTGLAQQPVDLIAFSNNPFDDDVTHELRQLMTQWHDIEALSDQQAATLIQSCQVDILVDLAGHTAHNRLPIFAWRAAPIQVSWLGYFASTGLSEVDYLIADPISVPTEWHPHFSEKICYLPETRLCMSPPPLASALPVSPPPVTSIGHLTFGSFQALAKINDSVLSTWQKILVRVPSSRLRLQIRYLEVPGVREALLQRIEQAGIPVDRVHLVNGTSAIDYFRAHNEVDIILDTFPFPGGTTTAEALWMGVPTLTLMGGSLLGRQGASMLINAGLPQWVAQDLAEYVERAVELASDTSGLARLRLGLRQQVLASALFDSDRFTAHFLSALQFMHSARHAE